MGGGKGEGLSFPRAKVANVYGFKAVGCLPALEAGFPDRESRGTLQKNQRRGSSTVAVYLGCPSGIVLLYGSQIKFT